MAGSGIKGVRKRKPLTKERWKETLVLYSMALLPILLLFVFNYIPIYGVLIAFQDYQPSVNIFSDKARWVGFKNFTDFIDSIYFGRLLKNTLWLNFLNLIFGFWTPIIFALLLNEVYHTRYKKFIQTASYMPYFLSNVVVVGMVLSFINLQGLVNNIIAFFGGTREAWDTKPAAFPVIYTVINVWKSFGFNSILYLSTIASIDPSLYESARIDGASRWQLMRFITLPGIKPTIAILLIMQVGSLLGSNSDLILLLYKTSTYRTADTFGTYLYRVGIENAKYSYTTAIGLMLSAINFVLVFIANKTSDKLTGYAMW